MKTKLDNTCTSLGPEPGTECWMNGIIRQSGRGETKPQSTPRWGTRAGTSGKHPSLAWLVKLLPHQEAA